MKLRQNKLKLIRLDYQGCIAEDSCIHQSNIDSLKLDLIAAREAFVQRKPQVVSLPTALLSDYGANRHTSPLGKLFRVCTTLHAQVDRVVVVTSRTANLGSRCFVESCCQPYWNELTRGERGSKPRIYFIDQDADNDNLQGLLHLLSRDCQSITPHADRWALVAYCDQTENKSNSVFEHLQAAHQSQFELDRSHDHLFVPILANGLESQFKSGLTESDNSFHVAGEPDSDSVFDLVNLVPAGMVGINVIEVLQGASAMCDHFQHAPLEQNLVLQYIARNQVERDFKTGVSALQVDHQAMRSIVPWLAQLNGPSPFAHRIKTYITVQENRFDDILPSIEEVCGAIDHATTESDPSCKIVLGKSDEHHLGQLLQLLLLISQVTKTYYDIAK